MNSQKNTAVPRVEEAHASSHAVSLKNAAVEFGKLRVLDNIDLTIENGAFISILGPSGCGKSTLLRLVSDLVPAAEGEVSIFGSSTESARLAREFSFVFQDATLLPWRSAIDNVRLPLEIGAKHAHKRPLAISDKTPEQLLELVGLKGRESAMPHELSGGMRQRVAIARALVCKPRLLLMDEPFGALDEITRDHLNEQILKIWQETGTTILFVTHSIPEAIFLGQKILMLAAHPGRVREMVEVDLPYPRHLSMRDTHEFTDIAAKVRNLLESCS
ncbi:MAG: ABC transporter ATP-binding protein [Amphritea sp.]